MKGDEGKKVLLSSAEGQEIMVMTMEVGEQREKGRTAEKK